MVTNMVFFLHLFVYYTYCTRHNEQLHMHKLWTDNNNNHNSSNQGGVNSRTIWRKSFQNFSIRWAVHVLAAFTLIQSLGYQIRTMDAWKRLFLPSHEQWMHEQWMHETRSLGVVTQALNQKREWCLAAKSTVTGTRIHVVARIPIPDSTNMLYYEIHCTSCNNDKTCRYWPFSSLHKGNGRC